MSSRGEGPKRTGETVYSRPVRGELGHVVAVRLIRELPDGTKTETIEPLEVPSPVGRRWAPTERGARGITYDDQPVPRPRKIPESGPRFGLLVAAIHHYMNIHPSWHDHDPYEAQAALLDLDYTDDLLPESEIAAALDFVRIANEYPAGRAE